MVGDGERPDVERVHRWLQAQDIVVKERPLRFLGDVSCCCNLSMELGRVLCPILTSNFGTTSCAGQGLALLAVFSETISLQLRDGT